MTPSYNQADFITDNLESIKRQTHPNVEHLVIDGESTDGTVDILRRYEDKYDLVWRSEPDEGQSDAINKGFELAEGEIVGWLNSDDVYFDTGVLKRVCDHFARTDADIIYGDLAYIDGDSYVTEVDVRPDFDVSKLPYRILIGQPATFFRREVVQDNRLDTTLNFGMDYDFWIRLSRHFEIRHVRDILAGFRVHELQKTEDEAATAEEVEEMLKRHYDSTDFERGLSMLADNAWTEADRAFAALVATYKLHRDPPILAFNGEFASFSEMLTNLGPSVRDIQKVLRRSWR
ncbi:hypothetical protein HTSR_0855 [Halodesulfurarchaeum formicicum]|uniref:Glycosyltransferase 2-like domain-containing protein n=1 Tax=Halodesulfurarchaeum formicicum TaxID=1873524 RepID=A0A1D8S3V9_9EURY|nr:hypothetical protein HTSR_0855 [Halodesulfurarchaeum formicicum]